MPEAMLGERHRNVIMLARAGRLGGDSADS